MESHQRSELKAGSVGEEMRFRPTGPTLAARNVLAARNAGNAAHRRDMEGVRSSSADVRR